ncbi:protein phosphatase 1G [Venturia canescens]|uniref:protein phosphatase 1G n=1 Tax=Venturia canescens TaxID=32260 RepID=UPI001C9BC616|nr:protein phosphatase 1G [Venturia canescens]
MGAYLSEPITKKMSSDERGKNVAFGASSMQGWRVSQEDAHNCCIEFDEDTSLFAVYDGHGGHEVATYCAKELPNFIKNTEAYKSGNIKQALIDAFLGFDAELAKPEVIKVLKEIAGTSNNEDDARWSKTNTRSCGNKNNIDDEEENVSDLRMEAAMPLEQVMARYSLCHKEGLAVGETTTAAGPSSSSSSHSWNTSDEPNVSSTSQPTVLKRDKESIEQPCTASNGESTNGLSDPDSSADVQNKSTGCSSSGGDVAPDDESNKVSSSLSEPLENGDVKESSCAASSFQSLLCKEIFTRRRAARIAFDKRKKINEKNDGGSKEGVTEEDEEDDDDDDEEDDDETFDGSPAASEEDATDEVEDEDDDKEQEDTTDEDENDNEDDDEEEEDDDGDDGDFTMEMTEEPGSDSGCTAVVAILNRHELYVANAGDSRCVLCRDGQALELSLDHKPEDEPEMERIVKAGGKVTADGRVNGGLNLSRALGDHAYKQNITLPPEQQMISALPDVRHIAIDLERDEFMILACDGIWNFMSSQEVVSFVRPRLTNSDKPNISKICEELFDHCLATDTLGDGTGCDNMTAVIVQFNRRNECSLESSKKRAASPSSNVVEATNGKDKIASNLTCEEGASKRSKIDITE